MQWYEILVIAVAAAFVIGVAVCTVVRKKKGKGGCDGCCDCTHCTHCTGAQKATDKSVKNKIIPHP